MNPFSDIDALITKYPKLKAWSYSRVKNHKKCALKIRFMTYDRLKEPDNVFQDRGHTVHAALGAHVKTGLPQPDAYPYPSEWYPLLNVLHSCKAHSELQIAFDKDWQSCGWFAPQAWCRVIVDAIHAVQLDTGVVTAVVTEFKTGKAYPEHAEQMRLYALTALLLVPQASEAQVNIWYIDRPQDERPSYTAQRTILQDLKDEFTEFSRDLLNDEMFPASPGDHCNYCHFRKSNRGPCHHG